MDLFKDFYTRLMSWREEEKPGASCPNQPNISSSSQDCQMSTMVEVVCKYEHQGSIISSSNKVKWLKHYSSDHRILLVGEGDFSFSLSLARAFGDASNIVATSLDSYDLVIKRYKGAKTNLEILHSLGAELLHEVDAFQMKLHRNLQMLKFDRIIYNFPHAGFLGLEDDPQVIKIHQNLVCGFFKNASGMLCLKGEVHVAHKTTYPFQFWNIQELATQNSLTLLECIKFKLGDYPGYNNKRGDGKRADEPFPLGECSTYKFGLFLKSSKSSKNDELCNSGPPLGRVEYTSLEKKNPNTRFKDGLIARVSKEGSVITCQRCFEPGHNNKTCKNEPVAPPPKIAKKKGKQRKVQEGDMENEGGPGGQTVGGQGGPGGQTVGGQGGNATTASASGSGNGKNEFVLGGTYPGFKASVGLGVTGVGNHASKGGPKSIPKWWGTGVTNCPVTGETFLDGRDSVPVPPWPPGVPMPSSSEMAKKIAATKHILIVDSGSQIGAAKPSQQVTPKKKQQTGQQPPPHRSRPRFLKIKPTAVIQAERRRPRLLKKKGATSASGSKTTGATPSQKATPKKKQQTGPQQPPHRSRPRFLKIKPTVAIQPERRSPGLIKKEGASSASGSKTTAAKPKKRTPAAAKPTQQVTPKKKQQTSQQQPPQRSPRLLKKKGATSASGSKTTACKTKEKDSNRSKTYPASDTKEETADKPATTTSQEESRVTRKQGTTSASGSKTTAWKIKEKDSNRCKTYPTSDTKEETADKPATTTSQEESKVTRKQGTTSASGSKTTAAKPKKKDSSCCKTYPTSDTKEETANKPATTTSEETKVTQKEGSN